MSEADKTEKSNWSTILGELDELVRDLDRLASIAMGDVKQIEGEEFPAINHFIAELKKEKKNKSWEKLEAFAKQTKESLTLLEETLQIKKEDKRIDRSFIGVLPKNTKQIGTNVMNILIDVPELLRIINEAVECLLIDIRLKLSFPTAKLEREIINLKHQIDLLEENIQSHTKTKKGFAQKTETLVYTQAYRETFDAIIENAIEYITRDFRVHSRTYEYIYQKFISRLEDYTKSPAYDNVVEEMSDEIRKTIDQWLTKGFSVFVEAQRIQQKIDHRMSDRRQAFIQQLTTELERESSEYIASVNSLEKLKETVDETAYSTIDSAKTNLVDAIKLLLEKIDVVAAEPHEQLIGDSTVNNAARSLAKLVYEATYGKLMDKLEAAIKLVNLSKSTRNVLKQMRAVEDSSLEPENLEDVIKVIPEILDFDKTMNLFLKELAVDLSNQQERFVKKIKNINSYFGRTAEIPVPTDDDLVKIEKIDLDDLSPIDKAADIMRKSLLESALVLSRFEEKLIEGLGIKQNAVLQARVERYKRPSYKPTVKQAYKAMNELDNIAAGLSKETGKAIKSFGRALKKFIVQSEAIQTLSDELKPIGNDASKGKLNLTQIIEKLEAAIAEYATQIKTIISEHTDEIELILTNKSKIAIFDELTLDNFTAIHNEFADAVDLEAALENQMEEKPELKCKNCGALIVSQTKEYNEMLGFDVLKVKCKNGHEDNIIGFADEKEEEPQEFKCSNSKCDREPKNVKQIELYTDDKLVVIATCSKRHKTEFIIEKK